MSYWASNIANIQFSLCVCILIVNLFVCVFCTFSGSKNNFACISSLLLTAVEQNTVENERKDLTFFFRSSRFVRNDGRRQLQNLFVVDSELQKALVETCPGLAGGDWQNRKERCSFFFFFNNSPTHIRQIQYPKCNRIQLGYWNVCQCFKVKLWWLSSMLSLIKVQSSAISHSFFSIRCELSLLASFLNSHEQKSRQDKKKLSVMQVGNSFHSRCLTCDRSWTLFLSAMEFLA